MTPRPITLKHALTGLPAGTEGSACEPSIHLTLAFPPLLRSLYRAGTNRTGTPIVRLSDEGKQYKEYVGYLALSRRIKPFDGPVAVTMRVYRPRRVGDIDSTQKITLDAMNGHCYLDDKQICELHVYRADDKQNPRVEIEIRPLERQV